MGQRTYLLIESSLIVRPPLKMQIRGIFWAWKKRTKLSTWNGRIIENILKTQINDAYALSRTYASRSALVHALESRLSSSFSLSIEFPFPTRQRRVEFVAPAFVWNSTTRPSRTHASTIAHPHLGGQAPKNWFVARACARCY